MNEVGKRGLCGRAVLVPGCGAGFDAIVLGKLGANVHAFDISPEMLALAAERAEAGGVSIDFEPMAAEQQKYPNSTFDLIFVRDLLHHCDIAASMREFIRVAKPGATIIIDELYTHSLLQWLRESRFGHHWLYPKIAPHLYKHRDPYITEDERKLDQKDAQMIRNRFVVSKCLYFNAVVNRFLPDWDVAEIADRALLNVLWPARSLLSGRFVMEARIPN